MNKQSRQIMGPVASRAILISYRDSEGEISAACGMNLRPLPGSQQGPIPSKIETLFFRSPQYS